MKKSFIFVLVLALMLPFTARAATLREQLTDLGKKTDMNFTI